MLLPVTVGKLKLIQQATCQVLGLNTEWEWGQGNLGRLGGEDIGS